MPWDKHVPPPLVRSTTGHVAGTLTPPIKRLPQLDAVGEEGRGLDDWALALVLRSHSKCARVVSKLEQQRSSQ